MPRTETTRPIIASFPHHPLSRLLLLAVAAALMLVVMVPAGSDAVTITTTDGKDEVVDRPEEVRRRLMSCSAGLRGSCPEAAELAGVTETEIFETSVDNLTEAQYNVSCGRGTTCAAAWESYFLCAEYLMMKLPADLYEHFDTNGRGKEDYLGRMAVLCHCPFPLDEGCMSGALAKQRDDSSSAAGTASVIVGRQVLRQQAAAWWLVWISIALLSVSSSSSALM